MGTRSQSNSENGERGTRVIRNVVQKVFLAVCLCLSVQSPSWSWQVITHYQLGVEAGADPQRQFQMLPDSWPSHGNFLTAFKITEWFAWTHAVQRTGRTAGVPNVPKYPDDGRNPGEEMYRLYKGYTSWGWAYETAIGFLGHNAQDRQVHYRYFRGGSRAAWVEEHKYKEEWADCWIFQIKMNGKFDGKGRPLDMPNILNDGNGGLISKAQENFRKSNRSTHSVRQETLPKQETISEIRTRLKRALREYNQYLSNFNKERCESLAKYAINYDWTLDELEERYSLSLAATHRTMDSHPR